MGDNHLETLDPQLFQGLKKLVKVTLANNKLKCLDVNLFSGLFDLVEVNIEGNELSFLEPMMFKDLTKFKYLIIGHNHFQEVFQDVLPALLSIIR